MDDDFPPGRSLRVRGEDVGDEKGNKEVGISTLDEGRRRQRDTGVTGENGKVNR